MIAYYKKTVKTHTDFPQSHFKRFPAHPGLKGKANTVNVTFTFKH